MGFDFLIVRLQILDEFKQSIYTADYGDDSYDSQKKILDRHKLKCTTVVVFKST